MIPSVASPALTPQDPLSRRDTPSKDPLRAHADQVGPTSADGRSPSVPKTDPSQEHQDSPRGESHRDAMARVRDTAREVLAEATVDRDSSADPALLNPDASEAIDLDRSTRAPERPELPFPDRANESAAREPANPEAALADPSDERDIEAADSIRSIQQAREAADTKFETAVVGDAERAARVLREFQAANEARREAAEAENQEKQEDTEVDAKQSRDQRFELARRSTKANVAEFLEITRRSVFDQVI